MFKPIVVSERQFATEQPITPEVDVKRVFMVLHGYYGNLFLTKFSTGTVENGEDQGIANARRIWAHGLRDFAADTIKSALRQCQAKHAEFPPSLPQFTALCAALAPRASFRSGPVEIGMSQQLRSSYAARARVINAKHADRKAQIETGERPVPAGLEGLKQAIASAIGAAGGDEAAELVRLDRLLPTGVTA